MEGCAAPPLELGVLPGVARARLEELAGAIEERRAVQGEMAAASVFVANAVRGVVPVASLDGVAVPSVAANRGAGGPILALTGGLEDDTFSGSEAGR